MHPSLLEAGLFENAVEGSGGKIVTGLARNRDPAQPGRMLELTMASLVAARYQPSSCSNRNTSLTFMSICAAGADPNCPNGGVLDLQDEAFELQPAGNLERRADRRAGADPMWSNGGVVDTQDEDFGLKPAGDVERGADPAGPPSVDHDVGLQAG